TVIKIKRTLFRLYLPIWAAVLLTLAPPARGQVSTGYVDPSSACGAERGILRTQDCHLLNDFPCVLHGPWRTVGAATRIVTSGDVDARPCGPNPGLLNFLYTVPNLSPAGTLFIKGGLRYAEPLVLNKPMVITAYDGIATIGPDVLKPLDLV